MNTANKLQRILDTKQDIKDAIELKGRDLTGKTFEDDYADEILLIDGTEPPQYIEATGGTETTYSSGGKNYKVHTFTTSGNLVVTQEGNGERAFVDYLIVAGGGGGGAGVQTTSTTVPAGSGGGGGGFITSVSGEGVGNFI